MQFNLHSEESEIGVNVVWTAEKLANTIETIMHGGKLPYHPSQEVLLRFTRRHLVEKKIEARNSRFST